MTPLLVKFPSLAVLPPEIAAEKVCILIIIIYFLFWVLLLIMSLIAVGLLGFTPFYYVD